ncbi:MAG: chromosome segregation protein SMC [Anaerolineaceae bacterium]
MAIKLKSLELHGYKTFASKTIFEFPGDLTAIVGPNGSGKSNIADSLRWVLGEQAYSLLRGRKTEDMIFSGSEQRARAGMASASITFNNDDGWLPIDFSEVSITRRAYRDGQNEYLLNGQRVRLKEISELLAQSGLAERTYTIIGQGLVDAALSLKPEERRRFFEEAAGIGLYRSRREESLNRLETTRRNIERVVDILSELEPRLRSLEKQAKRATDYEQVKADLRLLMRDWYGYQWHKLQKEYSASREVIKTADARLDKAKEQLSGIDRKLFEMRSHLQVLRKELNTWHTQSADLHIQREQLSKQLAVLEERQRSHETQREQLRSDIVRIEEETAGREERLKGLEEENARLTGELTEAQSEVETARSNLKKRQDERAAVDKTLRDYRNTLVESETRKVKLNAHQDELLARIEADRQGHEALEKAIQKESGVLDEAQEALLICEKERQQAELDQKRAAQNLQSHHKLIEEVQEKKKNLALDLAQADAEKTRLKAQLEVLEQAENSLSGLNSGAKVLMQAARQGKLNGRYEAISNKIIVPAKYEAAIAAVLGEFLDGIFLDKATDPEKALDFLASQENSRAVLYPSGWANEEKTSSLAKGNGVIGLAAELVDCEEELRPIINLLLGQVILVEDRQAARRVLKELPRHGKSVTLSGEVFYGNGAVVAGKENRGSIVARPRQKAEIAELLAKTAQKVSTCKRKIEDAEIEMDGLEEEEKSLAVKARDTEENLRSFVKEYQQKSLVFEQARQRQEWQHHQLADKKKVVETTEIEIKRTQEEIKANELNLTAAREKVTAASRELGGMLLDELQQEVNHWNTTCAVAERAVNDSKRRLEENRQLLSVSRQQKNQIEMRIEELQKTLVGLEEEKNSLRVQEGHLNQQIEEVQKKIEPSEAELEKLEADFSERQNLQMTSQGAVSSAERQSAQAKIEYTRCKEAQENMRRRIEEDFGLVAFEYTGENAGQSPLPLEGLVEELAFIQEIPPEIEENINRQRAQLRRMGAINPEAQAEYIAVKERFEFLTGQINDLRNADEDLCQVIAELDELMEKEFRRTFESVAEEFKRMFTRLFGGGSAKLLLTDENKFTETGIDIEAKLPGRREQGLSLLSGGERSLTAVALIFSLLKVSPTPFCVLDEVDAMLDETNVGRFRDLMNELSPNTQFIVITHNRNTVQAADVIYGITMGRDSASQMISLKLDEVSEEMVK